MRPVGLAALFLFSIATGCSTVPTERPSYRVVDRFAEFEVRDLDPYLVAETEVSGTREEGGNAGFRVLADYIFGKNEGKRELAMTAPVAQAEGTRIAMTAPVAQSPGDAGGSWTIQFMMPSGSTLSALPRPLDPRVRLRALPGRRIAVRTYSGGWSTSRYEEELARLRAGMDRERLAPVAEPVWARYDPPFKPWFMRTNEIWIEVGGGGTGTSTATP